MNYLSIKYLLLTASLFILSSPLQAAEKSAPKSPQCFFYGVEGPSFAKECFETGPDGELKLRGDILEKINFEEGFAGVSEDGVRSWIYVNSDGDIAARDVWSWDNGPDPIGNGFIRFSEGDKCGYRHLTQKKKTLKASFDGCWPFEEGLARVCVGCTIVKDDEHSWYEGGEFFCINPKGRKKPCRE